jgi:L-ascorbate metabolism protein UlaG (beta-lactamase superfamily)
LDAQVVASNLEMTLLKRAEKVGRKFLNPIPTDVGGLSVVRKVLPQYLRNKAEVEPKAELGPFRTDVEAYATPPASGLRVTWFGHSASLVEIDGLRVLIDPVWEQRASPFQFMGPKRFFQPTLELFELPLIDVVLVSHDHYDHLGAETVRRLTRVPGVAGARWITSLGVGQRLRGFGVPAERVVELDWTESVDVGGLKIASWPARHFSGRGVLDRFTTLWGSFAIKGPRHRVYYGADSGWWEGFGEIAARYDGFDLTMLEIGAFHPLWESIHLGPDNAARAFEAMGSRGLMMPIHWGLFNLALHAWRQPIERMLEIAEERRIALWQPEPGKPTEVVHGVELRSEWWKRGL